MSNVTNQRLKDKYGFQKMLREENPSLYIQYDWFSRDFRSRNDMFHSKRFNEFLQNFYLNLLGKKKKSITDS